MSYVSPFPSGTRNGLPLAKPYAYQGQDRDTLTGDKTDRQIIAEIIAHEGCDYRPPYLPPVKPAVIPRYEQPGTICGKPLWTGEACGRGLDHPGGCAVAAIPDERNRGKKAAP